MSKEHLVPHQWKKGQSGNPNGRPKGAISIIKAVKKKFEDNPEAFEEFLERYINNPQNEKHVAEMIDGKPQQKTDITSGGERIVVMPPEIIQKNNLDDSKQ